MGNEALALHRLPERAADRPGLGAAIEERAQDLGLARSGVAMLADVAVEAKGAVIAPFHQAFALQEVDRQDGGMSAVATAERQGAVPEIGERRHRTAADRDDLGLPAEIGVAHGNRPAAMLAPGIGLQKG